MSVSLSMLTLGGVGYTAAQRAGLQYERRVTKWLESEYDFYPQLVFETPRGLRVVDGLLFRPKGLVVVEIKTQHCEVAQRQLEEYVSIVREWVGKPVWGVEICDALRIDINDLPVVAAIDDVFNYSLLAVMAVSRWRLPRLNEAAEDGLGAANGAAAVAIRALGGSRDANGSVCSSANLAAAEGARGACQDASVSG